MAARGRASSTRRIATICALASALSASIAYATPPSIIATPINVELAQPGFSYTVNLRQLGVITGTAPLAIVDAAFLIGGNEGRLVGTQIVDSTPGQVCLTFLNRDFSPNPTLSYTLRLQIRGAGPVNVPVRLGQGPNVSPRDPSCSDPNSAPTVTLADPGQIIDRDGAPGESVEFTATATDREGDRITYEWLVNGVVQPNATSATAQLQLPDGGSRVTVRAIDEYVDPASATDTVSVTVPAPVLPTVNAGTDRTIADSDRQPGEAVALSGSATQSPVSLNWSLGPQQLGSGATLDTRLPDGVNTVTLTATYVSGRIVTDTVVITVDAPPANRAPTANAGTDRTINDSNNAPGESVTLDATGSSDPDGRIVSYAWSTQAGPLITTQEPTATVTLPDGVNTVSLTVTDDANASASDTAVITIRAANQSPVASAGPDRTIADSNNQPGESVTLDGSASRDPDGRIASFVWRDAQQQTIATTQSPTVTLGDGTHDLTLTVTDDAGAAASDTVRIIVSPAPRAPIANAGTDQSVADSDQVPGEFVNLNGSGSSDPDGTITTFQWFEGDEPLGTGQTLRVRLSDGAHSIRLLVTDNTQRNASDTVQITIAEPDRPEPQRPVANAGADQNLRDTNGAAGEPVTLTGTATDADSDSLTYVWTLGDQRLGTGLSINTSLSDGEHTVTFTVTDETGLSASDTARITIASAVTPTVDAGADQSLVDSDNQAGENVTLSGSARDSDGTIASYTWLLGDSPLGTGATLRTRVPDGIHTVTLRATDNSGLIASDTLQVSIAAPARRPTADAGADQTIDDTDGAIGELVTLSGSATDADGAIATYEWKLGDTILGNGATLQARLPDGVSTVSLTVLDNTGLTATDAVQITVTPPVLPIVDAGIAQSIEDTDVQGGEFVTLTGSATTNVGTITQYDWFLDDRLLASGQSVRVRLPDGANLVTLRATNSVGRVGTATVQVTVSSGVRTVLANVPGLTPNEKRLAAKLDEACNNVLGPIDAAPVNAGNEGSADTNDFAQKCRGLLRSRDNAALADAMGALLGDDFSAARTQTLLFANTQYASVMDRLIALRGGAKGLSLAGLNIVVDGELVPLAELQDLAKQLLGGGASSDADGGLWSDRWGLWARGNFSFGSKERNEFSPSFDADQYALLAGLDYRFSQSALIGAALAYGNSQVEFSPSGEGSLETESWALSLYGSVYAKKNFYVDAIVNIADAGYQANRNITYTDGYGLVDADAAGETGGMTMSAGMSGGYDFLIGGLTISPTLGVFYIDAQIDEFTELGAGGLNLIYDEQQFKSLTANLGMRMTFAWNLPFGVLLPHLRADYVREFEDDVDVFGIRFASDPNAASTPPILIETENPDSSYWRFAAGFSAQFKHGISGYVEYQRLESFQFISFQDVSLGLRFQAAF